MSWPNKMPVNWVMKMSVTSDWSQLTLINSTVNRINLINLLPCLFFFFFFFLWGLGTRNCTYTARCRFCDRIKHRERGVEDCSIKETETLRSESVSNIENEFWVIQTECSFLGLIPVCVLSYKQFSLIGTVTYIGLDVRKGLDDKCFE